MVQDKWPTRSDTCGRPEPTEGLKGGVPNLPKRGPEARPRSCGRERRRGRGPSSPEVFLKGSGGSGGSGCLNCL
jgi:hypothetical protein